MRKSRMVLKKKYIASFIIGMICCTSLIMGYLFFFKTDKFTAEGGVCFAVENKTGKEVYIWDGASEKMYKQRCYSFIGCYGDVYTDGSNLYYLKYDVKGDTKGLYYATVNAGIGCEELVTAKLVDRYRVGKGFVAYTVSDMGKNKLYIVTNAKEHNIKISDTCGDDFAVNESNICYYDLEEHRITIKNIETNAMYEAYYANEPDNISAIGKSGFAVVSSKGDFSIIDSSIKYIRDIKHSAPDKLEEGSQIYFKNGELYYITENGEICRKSIETGHPETIIDLNDIDSARKYIENGYIEDNMFYKKRIIISMTGLDERGEVKNTLLLSFDYHGNLVKQIII